MTSYRTNSTTPETNGNVLLPISGSSGSENMPITSSRASSVIEDTTDERDAENVDI